MNRREKYNYIIIGGGIIGLQVANNLKELQPDSTIAVLEAGNNVAPPFSQSASNSNVIHSGTMYPPGSLKALYCIEGNSWTKEFAKDNHIPLDECGKFIVATNPVEEERLEKIYENALGSEIPVEWVSAEELRAKEPNILGTKALFLPTTAVTDYTRICEKLADKLDQLGVDIYTNAEVVSFKEGASEVVVETKNKREFFGERVAITAGIQSDRLGAAAGFKMDWRMVPFRGEYYILPEKLNNITTALVYPVPDPAMPFLGVHLTKRVNGRQTVGPNAVMGWDRNKKRKLSFSLKDTWDTLSFPGFWKLAKGLLKTGISEQWDSLVKRSYIKRVKKYSPMVEVSDLHPFPCGIRAQALSESGEMIEDFDLRENGRIVLAVNLPSPAATSSYPAGRAIAEMLIGKEENE